MTDLEILVNAYVSAMGALETKEYAYKVYASSWQDISPKGEVLAIRHERLIELKTSYEVAKHRADMAYKILADYAHNHLED